MAAALLCLPINTVGKEVDFAPPPPLLTDAALAQVEEAFGDPPPADWEVRLAAWEKTPEGKKEMKMWRRLQ